MKTKLKNTLKNLNILCVEDDELNMEIIKRNIGIYCKEFFKAYNAKDGVEVFKFNDIDLVISDIEMPDINGLEMIKEIKKIKKCPIVIITAFNNKEYLIESIDIGVDGYILKPFKKEKLFETIHKIGENIVFEKSHKEMEEKLKIKQTYIQDILDSQSNLIVITDSYKAVNCNKKFLDFLGYNSFEAFKEEHNCVCEKFTEEDGFIYDEEDEKWLKKIIRNREISIDSKVKMYDVDKNINRVFIINYNKSSINEKEYIVSFTDISDIEDYQKLLKKENFALQENLRERLNEVIKVNIILEQKQNLITSMMDSSPLGIVMVNLNGRVIFANKMSKGFFDLKKEKMSNSINGILSNCKEDIKNCETCVKENILPFNKIEYAKKAIHNICYAVCKKNEEKVFLSIHGAPLFNKDKLFEGAIFNIEDVSKQIKLTEEKRKQEQILISQSKMVAMGEMIGNIAHQWRQPLNTLNLLLYVIYEEFFEKKLSEEKLDSYYGEARSIIEQMSHTIDDFRNFFKSDKKQETFDLNKIIKETLNIFNASFKFYEIEIKTNLSKNIKILGVKNEFSQVLVNILSNAKDEILKHNIKKASIEILTKKIDNKIIIEISDSAGGIEDKYINKIFEPYFTTKDEGKGTGIGLYMSKVIVEKNLNGNLFAKNIEFNNKKKGARFIIELPLY